MFCASLFDLFLFSSCVSMKLMIRADDSSWLIYFFDFFELAWLFLSWKKPTHCSLSPDKAAVDVTSVAFNQTNQKFLLFFCNLFHFVKTSAVLIGSLLSGLQQVEPVEWVDSVRFSNQPIKNRLITCNDFKSKWTRELIKFVNQKVGRGHGGGGGGLLICAVEIDG